MPKRNIDPSRNPRTSREDAGDGGEAMRAVQIIGKGCPLTRTRAWGSFMALPKGHSEVRAQGRSLCRLRGFNAHPTWPLDCRSPLLSVLKESFTRATPTT